MDVRELAVQKKRELKGFLTVGTKYELKDAHDLSVAYTPGVAEPCLRIKDNEAESFELTCRSNMVAVVSDGTRVLESLATVLRSQSRLTVVPAF